MRQSRTALAALTLATALTGWACSSTEHEKKDASAGSLVGPSGGEVKSAAIGDRRPSTETSPAPSPLPSPGASPAPVTVPGGSCPMGDGVPVAECGRGEMRFYERVQAAVDQVVLLRPELFDTERVATDGGFLVRDVDAFYHELVLRLQAMGLCAQFDVVRYVVQVKQDDLASEDYAMVTERGYLNRGEGAYLSSCSPATFPLAIDEIISYVRVGFYGIECWDGQDKPGNNERKLPIDCFGLVTATPKKTDGRDVDARLHGPEISWRLEQIDDFVDFQDDPQGNPFNKVLRGLDPGPFRLCATVQGIEGCMDGEVLHPSM